MFNIKVSELIQSVDSLRELSEINFNARISFKISRLLRTLQADLDDVTKQQREIYLKYGEEVGEEIKVGKEQVEAFNEEYQEFLDTEIEIPLNKILVSDFGDNMVSPKLLYSLDSLIEDDGLSE